MDLFSMKQVRTWLKVDLRGKKMPRSFSKKRKDGHRSSSKKAFLNDRSWFSAETGDVFPSGMEDKDICPSNYLLSLKPPLLTTRVSEGASVWLRALLDRQSIWNLSPSCPSTTKMHSSIVKFDTTSDEYWFGCRIWCGLVQETVRMLSCATTRCSISCQNWWR